MPPQNPYDLLDLPKEATPDQIKKAYRKKAKSAHPDAGGDPEAFNALARGAAVLLDPARRDKFDRTGEFDDKPDHQQAEVMQLLSQIVANVIQTPLDLAKNDVPEVMRLRLREDLRIVGENIESLNRAAKRLDELMLRMKPKKPGQGVPLPDLIAKHQQGVAMEREKLLAKARVYELAIETIDGHDYEFDKWWGD